MSAMDLIRCISERVSDPLVLSMLKALSDKIPKELLDCIEAERRSRSIVVAGVQEAPSSHSPSQRQKQLEENIADILDVLEVECTP
ncbi:unnamed protein product, partial [Nippostrongylus brasiliensis]|uniref:GED domain-containing protein n=1 Tax=Nippostrongylus brasiliensis TaxID=27835 RepID=A0A0N4YPR0_NIPBR